MNSWILLICKNDKDNYIVYIINGSITIGNDEHMFTITYNDTCVQSHWIIIPQTANRIRANEKMFPISLISEKNRVLWLFVLIAMPPSSKIILPPPPSLFNRETKQKVLGSMEKMFCLEWETFSLGLIWSDNKQIFF